jgi:hypothetical protein
MTVVLCRWSFYHGAYIGGYDGARQSTAVSEVGWKRLTSSSLATGVRR